MVDLREKIEEERGLHKKIQLAFPGYRGYRLEEDARASDLELRKQLGKKIESDVIAVLQETQAALLADGEFMSAGEVKDAVDPVRRIQIGVTRLQTGGFSFGVMNNFYMTPERINALYDYDWSMIETVIHLEETAQNISSDAAAGDLSRLKSYLKEIREEVQLFEKTSRERMDTIQGKKVFE
ncbi:hypothetical protein [Methanorbis furvi]|uniref:Uncharacterized protein n=1 Tax=Methanorbis furvi TaxID=3028299 RepID=A0AAE4MBA4_9EURY|nr:hypothetical protein [Methanocorpusculaceae archaeon Ag1]